MVFDVLSLDGAAPHVTQRVNLAVVAKSPIERIQELAEPGMERTFGVMLGQGLYYSNCQTVFRLFEIKNCFASSAALLLFPLKNLFDVAVLDNRHALIEVEEPLNNLRNGIEVDISCCISSQRRQVIRSLVLATTTSAVVCSRF